MLAFSLPGFTYPLSQAGEKAEQGHCSKCQSVPGCALSLGQQCGQMLCAERCGAAACPSQGTVLARCRLQSQVEGLVFCCAQGFLPRQQALIRAGAFPQGCCGQSGPGEDG